MRILVLITWQNNFYIVMVALFIIGCKTPKPYVKNEFLDILSDSDYEHKTGEYYKKLLKDKNIDSLLAMTTDFYNIKMVAKPNKKIFKLDKKKTFSLKIVNYGTKELYLPEWFRRDKCVVRFRIDNRTL